MIGRLKKIFGNGLGEDAGADGRRSQDDIRVAVCALFVEIGRIDETFTPAEVESVIEILKDKYGLSPEHADVLIQEATRELDDSLDLWQFAKMINANYSNAQKMEIVELMWRIVYVDGKMDDYEHYLMNKIKNLLRISHKDLIDAKLKVLHSS